MDIKRFQFLMRLLRYFRRRHQKFRARRRQKYKPLNNIKNVELWKEKDKLVPADYTDYRWRAQNKHHEQRHGNPRDSAHTSSTARGPGRKRMPSTSNHNSKYGSKNSRGSFRNQRQEVIMHPGHHPQCACLVVKRYTQEMHLRAEREKLARASHQRMRQFPTGQGQEHQTQTEMPYDHHRRSVNVPQPNNDPFGALAHSRHQKKPSGSNRLDTHVPQVYIPILPNNPWITAERLKVKTKRSQERIRHVIPIDAEPANAIERCVDLNAQQEIEVDVHRQPSYYYPTPMPMPSTNPFLEGAKDTLETVGASVKRVSGQAMDKVKHGAEIARRQKHHVGRSYNKLESDEHLREQYQYNYHVHETLPPPNPNTNPFLNPAPSLDSVTRTMDSLRQTLSDTILEGGEVVGRLGHHRPGEQSYDRLPSDTVGDFLDDFIDSSDHSRLDSDTIDNFLDDLDESTLDELKDLDQSSLCELRDMCLQLQTIAEENSGDEADTESGGPWVHQTRQVNTQDIRRRSSGEPVQRTKIPVAIVPPQTSTSSPETATDFIAKDAKSVGKNATNSAIRGVEMAEEAPSQTFDRHHSGSDVGHLQNLARNSTGNSHEHGAHCACEVVRRYTEELNMRDYERKETKRREQETPSLVLENKQGQMQSQHIERFEEDFSNLAINEPVNDERHSDSTSNVKRRLSLPTADHLESPHPTFIAPANWVQFHDEYKSDVIGEGVSYVYQQINDGVRRGKERIERMKVHANSGVSYSRLRSASSDEDASPVKETPKRLDRPVSEPRPTFYEDPATGVRIYRAVKKPKKRSKSKPVTRSVSAPSGTEEMADNERNNESLNNRANKDVKQDQAIAGRAKTSFSEDEIGKAMRRPASAPGHMCFVDLSPSVTCQSSTNAQTLGNKKYIDPATGKEVHVLSADNRIYENIKQIERSHYDSSTDVKSLLPRQSSEPISGAKSRVTNNRQSLPELQLPGTCSEVIAQKRYTLPAHVGSKMQPEPHQHQLQAVPLQEKYVRPQEKQTDIQRWVENVTPGPPLVHNETMEEKSIPDAGPRDFHKTDENQINSEALKKGKGWKVSQKKKSSKRKPKHKAGLRWARYRSLVDLQDGQSDDDDGWEDEVEMKKRKRKARRKKTLKRVRANLKFILEGLAKVNEEGVYYPKLYYSNQSPRHRPRYQ